MGVIEDTFAQALLAQWWLVPVFRLKADVFYQKDWFESELCGVL